MDNNHKQNGEDNETKPNFLEICNNLLLFEIRRSLRVFKNDKQCVNVFIAHKSKNLTPD